MSGEAGDYEPGSFLRFTPRAHQGPDSDSMPRLSRNMAEESHSNGTVKPFHIFREQLRVAPRDALYKLLTIGVLACAEEQGAGNSSRPVVPSLGAMVNLTSSPTDCFGGLAASSALYHSATEALVHSLSRTHKRTHTQTHPSIIGRSGRYRASLRHRLNTVTHLLPFSFATNLVVHF